MENPEIKDKLLVGQCITIYINRSTSCIARNKIQPVNNDEGFVTCKSHTLIEKSRACSSRCGGPSQVSSYISCKGWVGEWDQIWTDSSSQRHIHKLTFNLNNKNCKPPWDDTWYVRYINTHSFIQSFSLSCLGLAPNTKFLLLLLPVSLLFVFDLQ